MSKLNKSNTRQEQPKGDKNKLLLWILNPTSSCSWVIALMNMRVHAPHPTPWAKAITHQPLQLRRNNKDQQGDRHWKMITISTTHKAQGIMHRFKLTYLGVNLPPDFSELKSRNNGPLIIVACMSSPLLSLPPLSCRFFTESIKQSWKSPPKTFKVVHSTGKFESEQWSTHKWEKAAAGRLSIQVWVWANRYHVFQECL